MWVKRLLKLISEKPRAKQSEFEKVKEALKPTQTRSNPPKSLTPRPKIKRLSR